MGFRRAGAAFFAAVLACSAGCGLISGASDLEVDPQFGAAPPFEPDGGLVEASPIPRLDAAADAASDANVDAAADGSSRVRVMSFESGSLTGAQGGDSVMGSPQIATGAGTLAGLFSARFEERVSFVQANFSPLDDLYATYLVRFDNIGLGTVVMAQVSSAPVPFGGGGSLQFGLDAVEKNLIAVSSGDATIATGGRVTQGPVYRVGLHLRQGNAGVGVIEVFVALRGVAFGPPVITIKNRAVGRSQAFSIGNLADGNLKATYDDVILDRAAMPPP